MAFYNYCHKTKTLGCIRNRKTEEKIIQNRRTTKKIVQNRKPRTKQSKANKMVISVAYKANYANSYQSNCECHGLV